jgi:hypothetical protein
VSGLQRGDDLLEFINSTELSLNYQGMPNNDYIENEDGSITWWVSDSETIQRMSEAYRALNL